MATELGVAYLSLTASTKDFASEVRKALGEVEQESGRVGERSGSKIGAGISTGLKVVGGAVAGVTGLVAGLALKGGISRALAIEDAQAKLKGLGHSTESVQTIMDSALASVKGTAFGLGDAATVAASVVAAGVQPGTDLTRTLSLVADASTIAGTSMSDMGAIFNKVASTNKVQGEVLAQLGERGIPIISLLAQEMGVSAEEVSKLASQGKVDFATFQAAIESGMGGAALASGETFRGALANTMAALGRLGEKVVGGVLPQIKDGFGDAISVLDSWAPHAEAAGAAIGSALAGAVDFIRNRLIPAVQDTVTWFRENATTVKVVAGVVGAALLPVLASVVTAWVVAEARAVRSAAVQFASHYKVVAGWVMSAAAAVRSGAQTAAIWLMYQADAARAAAATVAAHARIAAAWVMSRAQAVASAAASAAAWVAASARTVAALVAQNAALVASRAVMIAGVAATTAVTVAQWAWNAALTANPIGIVVVAIAALVGALIYAWKNSETFRNVVTSAWNGVKAAASAVGAWFTQTIPAWWNSVLASTRQTWASVVATFNQVRTNVSNAVQAVLGVVRTVFSYTPIGFITTNFGAIVDFFRGIPDRIRNALGNVSTMLRDAGAKIVQGLADGIKNAVGRATDAIRGVVQNVRDFLPFSPAKRGPFAGRGYSLYSGQALAGDFAKGMLSQRDKLGNAAGALMGAAALVPGRAGIPSGAMAGGSSSTTSPTLPSHVTLVDESGGILAHARVVAEGVVAGRERDAAGRSNTRGPSW